MPGCWMLLLSYLGRRSTRRAVWRLAIGDFGSRGPQCIAVSGHAVLVSASGAVGSPAAPPRRSSTHRPKRGSALRRAWGNSNWHGTRPRADPLATVARGSGAALVPVGARGEESDVRMWSEVSQSLRDLGESNS